MLEGRLSLGPGGLGWRIPRQAWQTQIHGLWWVLRDLEKTVVRSLRIIFERLWWPGQMPEDWKKAKITQVFNKSKKEHPGDFWLIIATLIHRNVMECLILEGISIHTDGKKVIRSSQYGFTEGKSCLPLSSAMKQLPEWVREEQWMLLILTSAQLLTLSPTAVS